MKRLNDRHGAVDKGDETATRAPVWDCRHHRAHLIAACLIGPAAAQQPAATKRSTVALPALAAQGFEVKAAFASYLVLQKGKDVWLCYMLQTRSSCEPAE
jgi:hypothetical protein